MAGQDHFERDRAVEPLLPRLVDHAHPAAADLTDQLVRAEIARHRARQRRGICSAVADRWLVLRRRGQLFERLQAIQRRGPLWMFPQDRNPIRLLAGLQPSKEAIESI